MTSRAERLVIRSDLAELDRLFAFIDEFCARETVRDEIKYKLYLIAEELAVNVVSHGYSGRSDGSIEITLRRGPDGIDVCIEDEAPPFDPLGQAPAAVTDGAVADRPVGGLGVYLARTLAATVAYRFRDGRNVFLATVSEAP